MALTRSGNGSSVVTSSMTVPRQPKKPPTSSTSSSSDTKMTELKPNNPIRRETATYYRGRPLVVELPTGFLELREKGRRFSISVDYRAILDLGFKLKVMADREEKRQRRKGEK